MAIHPVTSTRIISPKTMIVVPYVEGMLRPETKRWAAGYTDAELVELDANDDTAYYEFLRERWAQPGNLFIVEQDIVPTVHTVVETMLRCNYAWCTTPYPIAGGNIVNAGLGCVMFKAAMKKKWGGVIDRVGRIDDDGSPPKTWRRLDVRVARVLTEMGFKPHSAHRESRHLHDYTKTD